MPFPQITQLVSTQVWIGAQLSTCRAVSWWLPLGPGFRTSPHSSSFVSALSERTGLVQPGRRQG